MEEHEIKQWLTGSKDFSTGIMLYSKYGTLQSVVSALRRQGNCKPAREMLERSLRNLLAKLTGESQQPVQALKASTSFNVKTSTPTNFKPVERTITHTPDDTAAKLQIQANTLYAEMGVLHARLGECKSDEDRKRLFHELIHVKQKAWSGIMYQRDYYLEHGTLPPANENNAKKAAVNANTSANNYQHMLNLRSKITRALNEQIPAYEKKLKAKPNDNKTKEKLKKRIAEVEQWKAEIEKIKSSDNG